MSLQLRKMNSTDIQPIRKLPVHLAGRDALLIPAKRFRVLMHDRNYCLLICERDQQVAAFVGLAFRPSAEGRCQFLEVDMFAADRFAFAEGTAAELEAHATELGKAHHCAGLIVDFDRLADRAKFFYEERGYIRNGNTLLKAL
jgi:hypothetical protein